MIAEVPTFGGVAHTIFSRIRHYGGTSPMVLNRLLEAVATFGPHVRNDADREIVRDEVEAVLRTGRKLIISEADVHELEKRRAARAGRAGDRPRSDDWRLVVRRDAVAQGEAPKLLGAGIGEALRL